jgi:hypothetical protein
VGPINSESDVAVCRCFGVVRSGVAFECVWDACSLPILVLWIIGQVCDISILQLQRHFLNAFTVIELYLFCKNFKRIFLQIFYNSKPYFKVYNKGKSDFLFLLCLWRWPQGAEICKTIHQISSILLNLLTLDGLLFQSLAILFLQTRVLLFKKEKYLKRTKINGCLILYILFMQYCTTTLPSENPVQFRMKSFFQVAFGDPRLCSAMWH